MRFRTASVIVVVCALWTFNLSAQDAKSTNAPSVSPILSAHGTNTVNASDGASSLAELPVVTVTARKGAEPAQSTPVSVTAVNADTIEAEGVHTVKDAAIYAPNVNISEFTVRRLSSPFFRGIGASVNNPGITTFYDGVPQFNANSSSIELVDVNQVEFVRGPQSALFGRNTVGGLINITSREPSLSTWRSDFETQYGNYSYFDERFGVSGPMIKDQLGMSFAGGYSSRDGYAVNDTTGHAADGREAFFGKVQMMWKPADDLTIRLIVSGEKDHDGDYALGDLNYIRANPHHVVYDFDGYTHRDVIAPTLLVDLKGEAVDFSSITGLVWWHTHDYGDLSYYTGSPGTNSDLERGWQFSQEFRLGSAKDAPLQLNPDLQLKWQAGVQIFTQNYTGELDDDFTTFGYTWKNFSDLNDVGAGAYGQTTLTAWEKLDFIVGIRGDYENKSAHLRTSYDPVIAPGTDTSPSKDFSNVTPQFGIAYHLSKEYTFFGTISRGYKAGGFNATPPAGFESYDEETSWNYEIGAKTSWLDNKLLANLTFYYINWENLQLTQPDPTVPGNYYIANAGSAESKGVELEIIARPLTGWDVFAGAGVADTEFLSDAHAIHTDAFGTSSTVGLAGNQLPNTPLFTANCGAQYTWQVCKAAALYARAEMVATGRYYYNPANTAAQDAYTLANFRAGVRGKNWFAEGWVRNAFDTHYVPLAFEDPNGQSGIVGQSGDPVTFGLRAGVYF